MEKKPLASYLKILEKEDLVVHKQTCCLSLAKFQSSAAKTDTHYFHTLVSGLFSDSRKCKRNGIFFCKGRHFSDEYLTEALQRGATAIVYDSSFRELIKEADGSLQKQILIEVKNVRRAMALLAAFHFDYPMKKAITVAVTGTKGKTGTVAAICNSLNESPCFKAIILNDALPKDSPHLTTPEPIDFHAAARECVKRGATHIICEISSQGVKEYRTYGIVFDAACFLNFGTDHISPAEHPTLQDYFNAKASLFTCCKRAVINLDSEKAEEIIRVANESVNILSRPKNEKKEIYTFSLTNGSADFLGKITEESENGSLVTVTLKSPLSSASNFLVPFPGKFNIENSLAVFSVCRLLGCTDNEIFRGILSSGVPGRMETFDSADGRVRIIVDYAHNKMSFEGLFNAARHTYAPRSCPKITAIFGCSGEKAFGRRYDLPEVALRYSDRIIICEDDSGREPFENIRDGILQSIDKILSNKDGGYIKNAKISVIRDREKAISTAVKSTCENGEERLILFLGKGRESTMATGKGPMPVIDDVSAALNAIKEYDRRISLDTLFFKISDNSGKFIAIALDSDVIVIENFSASVFRFLRAGVNLMAICSKQDSLKLEESCFKNGVSCHFTESRRHASDLPKSDLAVSCLTEQDAVHSATERGVLYVVTVNGNVKMAATEISVREKADALVYLTRSGNIIFNGKKLPSRLTEKTAALLSARINLPYLKAALKAVRGGIATVAIIDGQKENALAFYGAGSGFTGTVINKTVL